MAIDQMILDENARRLKRNEYMKLYMRKYRANANNKIKATIADLAGVTSPYTGDVNPPNTNARVWGE
jgi:hypothetical protein